MPASGTDPAGLVAVASVELLLRGVRKVDPSYPVDAGNAEAIGEIYRRLDGLPLALELAAAGPRLLSPWELTGMLGRGVTALQAVAEMDAGPIWGSRSFTIPSSPPRKSALYNGPVADAAIELVLEVVAKAADPQFRPSRSTTGAPTSPAGCDR